MGRRIIVKVPALLALSVTISLVVMACGQPECKQNTVHKDISVSSVLTINLERD